MADLPTNQIINGLTKFLSTIFVYVLVVAAEVSVLVYGWGLTPKSWWWIVGIGVFGMTFLGVLRGMVNGTFLKASQIVELKAKVTALEVEEEARKARANASEN